MKDLLKTNCFDVPEVMIVVGSCLKAMQPKAYEELEKISSDNVENKQEKNIDVNYIFYFCTCLYGFSS